MLVGVIHARIDHAHAHAEEAVQLAHPGGVAPRQVVVDGDHVHALAGQRIEIHRQRRRPGSCPRRCASRRSCPSAAPCRRSAARRNGACRARAWRASRTTAKASGSSLSSVSPAATRCLNSSVLARSASSLSFSISGSSALMRATFVESWRSTRSLRLPNRLVRARLNIGLPDWGTECPQQARANRAYYYMPINGTAHRHAVDSHSGWRADHGIDRQGISAQNDSATPALRGGCAQRPAD